MDKIKLLKEFYNTIDRNVIKLGLKDYGFDLLKMFHDELTVDYVSLEKAYHWYRLSNISPQRFDYFLKHHIEQNGNICGYFDKTANSVFAFNLDAKPETTKEEIEATRYILTGILVTLGIKPLVVVSGRGYHIWVKLEQPIDNDRIGLFMFTVCKRITWFLEQNSLKSDSVDIGRYPHGEEKQRNSLRLFGSRHVDTLQFSNVVDYGYYKDANEGWYEILNEKKSWEYFERYLMKGQISVETFDDAFNENVRAWGQQCKPEIAKAI